MENIIYINAVVAKFGPMWSIIIPALIVFVASALDAAIPNPAEGTVGWYAKKVISFLAINVGNAKNAK